MRAGGAFLGFVLALGLAGCSATAVTPAPDEVPSPREDAESKRIRDLALTHVIEGSIQESKGEFAKAILEFQDALRYSKDPAIYYGLAKNYSILSKHSLAIEAGREAVRLAPDEITYRQNLADICAAAFEFDAAAEQYEEIIKRDSTRIDVWYNLARILQTRRPLRALEVYEQIIARFGPEWDVLLQMAELYSRLDKHDKAAEALRQMTEIDPGNKALKESLAQTYMRAGSHEKALALLEELRETYPDDLNIQAEIAGVYLIRKEYARAAGEFDAILRRDSVNVDVKIHIGELYFAQVTTDSTLAPVARTIFERIAEKHPDDWRPFWFLGALGSIMKNDSLASAGFRRVTELASWNADAWVYLSSVFLGNNNFGEVARILESAMKVLPDDFRVNFFLGIAYSRLGRNEDAVRVLEHARQLNPKDVDAIAQLALVYDTMRKTEDSDRLYEEALKLDPANSLILNNYAYSLAERGLQLERALRMAQVAVEAQPDNPSYLDTIGWIYFRLGQYRDAEKWVKEAINKGEASAVVYEHLGDIYYRLNDREQAMEHWNMALRLDGSNAALRDKISRGSL